MTTVNLHINQYHMIIAAVSRPSEVMHMILHSVSFTLNKILASIIALKCILCVRTWTYHHVHKWSKI